MEPNIDTRDPIFPICRTDRVLPREDISIIDKRPPTWERPEFTLSPEPIRTRDRTLADEPTARKSQRDILPPMRPKFLTEKLEPMQTACMMLARFPTLAAPPIDIPEPILAKARKDMLDP